MSIQKKRKISKKQTMDSKAVMISMHRLPEVGTLTLTMMKKGAVAVVVAEKPAMIQILTDNCFLYRFTHH